MKKIILTVVLVAVFGITMAFGGAKDAWKHLEDVAEKYGSDYTGAGWQTVTFKNSKLDITISYNNGSSTLLIFNCSNPICTVLEHTKKEETEKCVIGITNDNVTVSKKEISCQEGLNRAKQFVDLLKRWHG